MTPVNKHILPALFAALVCSNLAVAAGASGGVSAGRAAKDAHPSIEVTALCAGEVRCIYDQKNVNFSINIKNTSGAAIMFPLEFVDHAGPYLVLHDNRRKHSEIIPSRMRDERLLIHLSVLLPGQTVSIAGSIDGALLEEWGGASVDVTAEIEVAAPLDQTMAQRLIGKATLRIVGKNVAEAEAAASKR